MVNVCGIFEDLFMLMRIWWRHGADPGPPLVYVLKVLHTQYTQHIMPLTNTAFEYQLSVYLKGIQAGQLTNFTAIFFLITQVRAVLIQLHTQFIAQKFFVKFEVQFTP